MADVSERSATRRDESAELGSHLRSFREKSLRLTVQELAKTIDVQRTYIHDCEAGRKFASRSFIEKLVGLAEADPSASRNLLQLYDSLARHRSWRSRKPRSVVAEALTHRLNAGFPVDPPRSFVPVSYSLPSQLTTFQGQLDCADVAVNLVAVASESRPGTLLLKLSSPVTHPDWSSTLQRALACNWTVVHLMRPSDDPKHQIDLVQQVFSYVGFGGIYRPILLKGSASGDRDASIGDVLVAEGIGALQLLRSSEVLDGAIFMPWSESGSANDPCRLLLRHGRLLEKRGVELLSTFDSGGTDSDGEAVRPLPGKIAFDNDLTEATVRPGNRVLVKSGLVVSTMPPEVAEEQTRRWKEHVGPIEAGYIDVLLDNRTRRWNALHNNRSFISRDICTKRAVREYLSHSYGEEGYLYTKDPLYSGKWLTLANRIAHVRGLIKLLRETETGYELGLSEDASTLGVPVGDSYWQVTDGAVFFVTLRRQGGQQSALYGSLHDESTVAAFMDLFELLWEDIDLEDRDPLSVAKWLEEQAAAAYNELPKSEMDSYRT